MYQQIILPIILGLIEGVTEFLPISSTGHLIVADKLLETGGAQSAQFLIFIQLGAILSVVILYMQRFKNLLNFSSERGFSGSQGILKLGVACIPALVLGALFGSTIKEILFNPTTVAFGLIIGGVLLYIAERCSLVVQQSERTPTPEIDSISILQSFGIGIFQCLALWPGMSRSGSTIAGGLFLGCTRKVAAEFSFLVAVPIMCAAVSYDMLKNLPQLNSGDVLPFSVGFITAFLSALIAVKLFIGFVSRASLLPFVVYRISVGFAILWIFR